MTREMKYSGVEWIGDIPSEWKVKPISTCFNERNEKVSDYDWEPLSVTKQGILKQLETAAKSDAHDARKKVCAGDFVINSRSDRKQSCGVSEYDGSVSLINIVLKHNELLCSEYIKFALKNYGFAEEFYRWGNGIVDDLWSTNYQRMKKIMIPIPPLPEQKKIADFLDGKVSEIDKIIAETKSSIENYKEYKQSVITEAVTKGLDKNVPMKDSGIEWIGDIPVGWNVNMLSQIFYQHKYKNKDNEENNLLSLSYGNIKRKNINVTEGLLPESFENYNILDVNDIVLRLTDLQNDHKSLRVGYVEERGIITSAYVTIRSKRNINTKYFYYYLHTFDVHKGFYGMGCGVRQGLNFDELRKLKILYPPIDKQQQIIKYLDNICMKIDTTINKKEQLISNLEEYKKSLIYEYVTGKRTVE